MHPELPRRPSNTMECPKGVAVLLSEHDLDAFEIRDTAYNWHGGQWSDLYSFASTDLTIHSEEHRQGLLCEVETCISRFTPECYDNPEAELLKLTQLKQAIELIPVR